jgi:hypothetical protein
MDTPETKYRHRYWGGAGMGLIVIAIGVVFLLQNFGIVLPFMAYRNWWALFILIGAVPSLTQALNRFRTQGRFDGVVLAALLPAVAIVMVALFFLLELNCGKWWPLFVIYGGLWMTLGGERSAPP